MITAHLPAGYLTGRVLANFGQPAKLVVLSAVFGGVFPDFDLIWFYLIDAREFHHHHYWVHIPAFWVAIAAFCLPLCRWRWPRFFSIALAFFVAIAVHLLLDTIAGDVKWLWPFSDQFYHLVDVPASHGHWILNFVLHPVFVLELMIWVVALYQFRRAFA